MRFTCWSLHMHPRFKFPPLAKGGQGGGWSWRQPSTGLLKEILTGLASPRSSQFRENVRGVRSVRRHPPNPKRTTPPLLPSDRGGEFARGDIFRAIEICVEINAPHSEARGLFVIVSNETVHLDIINLVLTLILVCECSLLFESVTGGASW